MSATNELPADAPIPRLCHLRKWADFDGYGFNLHAEKSRPGQFIGKVDAASPAEAAGLREGDRIIEVNGVNIANENHRQVVERIKALPDETRLLVLDDEADKWYRDRKIVVKSTLPNVRAVATPVPRPDAANGSVAAAVEPPDYENIATNGVPPAEPKVGNGVHEADKRSPSPPPPALLPKETKQNGHTPEKKVESSPQSLKESPSIQKTKEEMGSSRSSTPQGSTASVPDSPHSSRSTNSSDHGNPTALEEGFLNLNMSAQEMRQMLANRRKKDPKKEPMDIRQKYEIIQQM